ncbi:MAG: ABC transporter ATP-binding protein [Euryarchaeota archaeon]|nr:ABC transporter ATP-binding protein [Euryarchaeota archaeon]
MDAISAAGIGKTYPKGVVALIDVSFKVEKGSVFCLLGRNGAGKTTLLRILATQLRPTTGKAEVLGFDVSTRTLPLREKIAVVPQEARPLMMLSAYDHIYYMCRIRGLGDSQAKARTQEIMTELELWEHKDKLTADLSGGLRQRVIIGMALIPKAELIFLDEPSIGLDPLGRRIIWQIIRKMTRVGVTVVLTTHYMDEAENLADKLLIIDKGRTVFFGTVDEAKAATGAEMKMILQKPGTTTLDREVIVPKSEQEIVETVQRGIREGKHVTFKPPTLEEAFIHFAGGSIEEET